MSKYKHLSVKDLNIKRLRNEKNMTQWELAIACGVSLATVRAWELGYSEAKKENLAKLCEVLEV
jgi:DNA-binding transcriptional regulator YiaG